MMSHHSSPNVAHALLRAASRLFATPFLLTTFVLFLAALPIYAIDGVVVNGTTSKPQAGVLVSLMQPGQGGMQMLETVKTDADGRFDLKKEPAPGPAIIQAVYAGATYNSVLTPGTPRTGISVVVNESTTDPASAKIAQHMVLLEPGEDMLRVNETFLMHNDTVKTYSNPAKGSVEFYLPREANGTAQVTITAPGGMPIQRPAEQTNQPGVFKVGYPVKPGETRFEVHYSMPKSDTYASKNVAGDGLMRLVTPGSVTLAGDGLEDLGQEPQTQAHIYNVKTKEFSAAITGAGSLTGAGAQQSKDDSGAPQVEETDARIYTRLYWVLGLTFALLGAGGVVLYRKGTA
jgi:hypothetical protein